MLQRSQWPSYHWDAQCKHVPQSIKLASTASLPKVIFVKAFWEVSSYSTIHSKCTPAYLILDCTNGRTLVIYRPRVHVIYMYISTGTDIYLYIQEAPVSYAWNGVCFEHWEQPFLVEHSPWLFGSKKSSSAQSESFWMCCNNKCVPSRLTSHRWQLNLSATRTATHRYDNDIHLCYKKSFCSGSNPSMQNKEKSKWLVFRQICNSVLCFLMLFIWSLAREGD